MFRPKGEEVTGNGENCKMRIFIICTLYRILFIIIIISGTTALKFEEDEMGGAWGR
jgi:hypothetical protein